MIGIKRLNQRKIERLAMQTTCNQNILERENDSELMEKLDKLDMNSFKELLYTRGKLKNVFQKPNENDWNDMTKLCPKNIKALFSTKGINFEEKSIKIINDRFDQDKKKQENLLKNQRQNHDIILSLTKANKSKMYKAEGGDMSMLNSSLNFTGSHFYRPNHSIYGRKLETSYGSACFNTKGNSSYNNDNGVHDKKMAYEKSLMEASRNRYYDDGGYNQANSVDIHAKAIKKEQKTKTARYPDIFTKEIKKRNMDWISAPQNQKRIESHFQGEGESTDFKSRSDGFHEYPINADGNKKQYIHLENSSDSKRGCKNIDIDENQVQVLESKSNTLAAGGNIAIGNNKRVSQNLLARLDKQIIGDDLSTIKSHQSKKSIKSDKSKGTKLIGITEYEYRNHGKPITSNNKKNKLTLSQPPELSNDTSVSDKIENSELIQKTERKPITTRNSQNKIIELDRPKTEIRHRRVTIKSNSGQNENDETKTVDYFKNISPISTTSKNVVDQNSHDKLKALNKKIDINVPADDLKDLKQSKIIDAEDLVNLGNTTLCKSKVVTLYDKLPQKDTIEVLYFCLNKIDERL